MLAEFNEYGPIRQVAIRRAGVAFQSDEKIGKEWQPLRFHEKPSFADALDEYDGFTAALEASGAQLIELPAAEGLTLDSIYSRDALLVSPKGLILCNMGRPSRRGEPAVNADFLREQGFDVAGEITAPGTIEGGDLIWLHEKALAVGIGPRTNDEGVDQLQDIVGPDVEIHRVPLPAPDHPEDVFHLMSMISPIDKDLALIYRPLMPAAFIAWLEAHGIAFVEVPDPEFIPMGCNVLALGPRSILMLDRLPETKSRLEAAGCHIVTYKGDEVSRKGEGGPTCLTRPLVRG
jgi:N-dimethylarginine dimethylaminohydrolase